MRTKLEAAVNGAEDIIDSTVREAPELPSERYDNYDDGLSGYRIRRLDVVQKVYLFKLIYAIAGATLGFVSMIGGIILFLYGVVGKTSWLAEFLGAKSQITDAAPGAILFVVGLFVVLITRFRMKIQTGTGSKYWG